MNYPMAIVIAAALIAGAIFFSNQNDLDAAIGAPAIPVVAAGVAPPKKADSTDEAEDVPKNDED